MYTPNQMRSLGLAPNDAPNYKVIIEKSDIKALVYGKFKTILETIYSSKGTELDDILKVTISENAPESVRMFAQNLSSVVQALPGAPNDDVAFDTIIPRSVQSSAEFEPYLEHFRAQYDEVVANYKARQAEPPKTE